MKPFICTQLSSMARLQKEPGVPALRTMVGRQILLLFTVCMLSCTTQSICRVVGGPASGALIPPVAALSYETCFTD